MKRIVACAIFLALTTPALAERQLLICDRPKPSNLPTRDMYWTFDLDFEEVASGIVGIAKGTLDYVGNVPGTLGPATAYALNGDKNRYILKNLRTGYETVIDRRTGIAKIKGTVPLKCRAGQSL